MKLIITIKEIIVSYWGITRTERVTTTVVEDKESDTYIIPIDEEDFFLEAQP